jgi:prophage DNA circulation protein
VSDPRFDISLPFFYNEKWREAYRSEKDDLPRLSSYQAPNGEPIPFIYKSLEFNGGQSVDTAEYLFFGLWSNEAINQKIQTITVHGFLRGEYYLQQRTAFLAALMVPTSDDSPGFFDHPLWGRFKVVVENYNIQESGNENGQCEISLTLKRAGVSLDTRSAVLSPADFIKPKDVALTSSKIFAVIAGINADVRVLQQAFGSIKAQLLTITGILQLPTNILNGIVNEITGISNLLAQGIRAPEQLAQAFVNAAFSLVAGLVSIAESGQSVGRYFSGRGNEENAAINFLSAGNYKLPLDAVTVKQTETKAATENLYRTVCLCASAEILMRMVNVTLNKMKGYWALYTRLEDCISLEDPDLYKAISEMRAAVSHKLKQTAMSVELKKKIEKPVPLLLLSHYLGCDDDKLRAMSLIEDSLLVSGEVAYV